MTPLFPCTHCMRHVRTTETRCPFCDGALAPRTAARPMPATRLGRAATFAFGLGVSAAAVGCTEEAPSITTTQDAEPDATTEQPSPDAGDLKDAGEPDAHDDPIPIYALAPIEDGDDAERLG